MMGNALRFFEEQLAAMSENASEEDLRGLKEDARFLRSEQAYWGRMITKLFVNTLLRHAGDLGLTHTEITELTGYGKSYQIQVEVPLNEDEFPDAIDLDKTLGRHVAARADYGPTPPPDPPLYPKWFTKAHRALMREIWTGCLIASNAATLDTFQYRDRKIYKHATRFKNPDSLSSPSNIEWVCLPDQPSGLGDEFEEVEERENY